MFGSIALVWTRRTNYIVRDMDPCVLSDCEIPNSPHITVTYQGEGFDRRRKECMCGLSVVWSTIKSTVQFQFPPITIEPSSPHCCKALPGSLKQTMSTKVQHLEHNSSVNHCHRFLWQFTGSLSCQKSTARFKINNWKTFMAKHCNILILYKIACKSAQLRWL